MGDPPQRNLEPLFGWFDANDDGMLSREEFGELAQFVRRNFPDRPDARRGGPRIGRDGGGPQQGERGEARRRLRDGAGPAEEGEAPRRGREGRRGRDGRPGGPAATSDADGAAENASPDENAAEAASADEAI